MQQVTILRINGDGEADSFRVQLTLHDLADTHAVQHDRLPRVDAVALGRGQS